MIDRNFLPLLKLCQRLKPGEFESLVDHLSDKSIDNICECVFNVVNTDLKLPKRKCATLKRHIKTKCNVKRIKLIGNKKSSVSKRRSAIKQEGRGIPLILASVIPFLTSLFAPK